MQNLKSRLFEPSTLAVLKAELAKYLGEPVEQMAGHALAKQGAINRHWAVSALCAGKKRRFILRGQAEPEFPLGMTNSATQQAAWIALAAKAGLATAPCILRVAIEGRSYLLLDHLEGESDPDVLAARDVDSLRVATASLLPGLARLHASAPAPCFDRSKLHSAKRLEALSVAYQALYAELQALSELSGVAALHGDFRLANFLVDQGSAQILDFDFARAGHPAEDLGWLTAPCWTYSAQQAQAFDPVWLIEAYARSGGVEIAGATLLKAQIQAQLLWLDIALLQLERFSVTTASQRADYFKQHPQQEPSRVLRDAARLAEKL